MKKISIVTVCFNMEKYIEKTILSVINQKYANLEYIIIDGGSTDSTCAIINKYKKYISYFISEPDRGMYDAIRKGFDRASGDIFAWINADDQYLPWTFHYVNHIFSSFEDVHWIGGIPAFMNSDRIPTLFYSYPGAKSQSDIRKGKCQSKILGYLQQEGMFWRKELYEKVGGIDNTYRFAGDFELWTRFAKFTDLVMIDAPLALFMRRSTGLSISEKDRYQSEVNNIYSRDKSNIIERIFTSNKYFRMIYRLLYVKMARLIYYSDKDDTIVCRNVRRSASNYTLNDLIFYYRLNKK